MSNLETPREDRESPSPVSLSKKRKQKPKQDQKKKKSKNFLKDGQEGWNQNDGNLGLFHGE